MTEFHTWAHPTRQLLECRHAIFDYITIALSVSRNLKWYETRTQLSQLQYGSVYRTELQTYWEGKKGSNVDDLGHGHAVPVYLLRSTRYIMYQKGVYYSGVKVFNSLPRTLKDLSSKPRKFKIALKQFLQTHSFYSLDEFFDKRDFLVYISLTT